MTAISIAEAKTDLSRLIAAIETGRKAKIVIARNGHPVARLVPMAAPSGANRRPGLLAGTCALMTLEAFDAENEWIAALFSGEAT